MAGSDIFSKLILRTLKKRNGQSMVEVTLILALIAIIAIAVLSGMGFHLCRTFTAIFGNSWDAFLEAFGSSSGSANYNPAYDFNGDGTIDGTDMAVVGTHTLYNCLERRFM